MWIPISFGEHCHFAQLTALHHSELTPHIPNCLSKVSRSGVASPRPGKLRYREGTSSECIKVIGHEFSVRDRAEIETIQVR